MGAASRALPRSVDNTWRDVMKRVLVLGTVLVVGGMSAVVSSEQQLSQAALDATVIEQVRDNLYVITGSSPLDRSAFSGGNTGVYIGEEGITLVDTKLPGWGQALMDRIRTVSDKPVTTIINTHTHGDHVGSNSFFPETVTIVAHENTRSNMEGMEAFQGDGMRFLPQRTYSDRLTLGSGDGQIDLYYFGPGHTSGDTFVVFPALGVMHAGDMFPWQDAPFLDRNNGGSGLEIPETLAAAVAGIRNVDTVIPGHIPVTSWDDFVEFQRFNADMVAAARAGKSDGQTPAQAVAAFDLAGRYPDYRSDRIEAAFQTIYDELP
jgi:glyoxylase-like metal-dependent hydrolase (beta-lactamase superfamily II)